MTGLPPLEALVSHRGRMLLLSGIIGHTRDETICSAEITAKSILVASDGSVARWSALELMAQTIAVHVGLMAWRRNEPVRLGFLIGVPSRCLKSRLHLCGPYCARSAAV